MQELNCRGQACPAPVLQVKELLEKGTPSAIAVIVDNKSAAESVSRFLEKKHFQVRMKDFGIDFRVEATALQGSCEIMPDIDSGEDPSNKKIMVLVGTDRLGHGDDDLGRALLLNFIKTLNEMGSDLWRLVFVNNGVKLTVQGAEAVPFLRQLANEGVRIMVCGTCLEYFKLAEQKEVGEATNMLDIVTSMQLADSIINI
jgi:selenium metabolism protein YedF